MDKPLQIPHATDKLRVIQWADEQMQQGVSRQTICDALLQNYGVFSLPLAEVRARSGALHDIYAVMVDRNLDGIESEKQGRVEQAIALYEANLNDKFYGSHPYERLRIIYTKRKDYENATRVCRAFLDVHGGGYKGDRWQVHLEKLQEKQQADRDKPSPKSKASKRS